MFSLLILARFFSLLCSSILLIQTTKITSSKSQQRFKEVQVKLPGTRKHAHSPSPPLPRSSLLPPAPRSSSSSASSPTSSRRAMKEVLVCVSRGSTPEKSPQSSIEKDDEKSSSTSSLSAGVSRLLSN